MSESFEGPIFVEIDESEDLEQQLIELFEQLSPEIQVQMLARLKQEMETDNE